MDSGAKSKRGGKREASDWTPERIELLTRLWKGGVITSEIGCRLGITKNAAIGKVHRLNLRPRIVTEKPPKAESAMFNLRVEQCRYPIGHPNKPGFRFCDAKAKTGSAYCAQHHRICYIPTSSTEKQSAAWTEERKAAARERAKKRWEEKGPFVKKKAAA